MSAAFLRACPLLALAAGVAALFAAVPAAANRERPAGGNWTVDWGIRYCTLTRTGGDGRRAFAFQIVPGTEYGRIVLSEAAMKRVRWGDKAVATLVPSGHRSETSASFDGDDKDGSLGFSYVEESFIGALAQAAELRIEREHVKPLVFATPRAAAAVSALRKCVAGLLARWGIAPEELAALQVRAKPVVGHQWLENDDYPKDAIRANAQGYVIARVLVAATGRVEACDVVVSSGHASLDRATCSLAIKRGRYSPAIGSDGKPVPAKAIAHARWVLPVG